MHIQLYIYIIENIGIDNIEIRWTNMHTLPGKVIVSRQLHMLLDI